VPPTATATTTPVPGCIPSGLIRENEPNDTPGSAEPISSNCCLGIEGDIDPSTDTDYFIFTGNAGDRAYAYVQTNLSTRGQNTHLALVDNSGIYYLDWDDNDGTQTGQSSSVAGMVLPYTGIYYWRVSSANWTSDPAGRITPYRLWIALATGPAQAESEPNDTSATADPFITGRDLNGDLATSSDSDWFAVPAVAGQYIYVSQDNDPEGDGGWPARMQLIAPNGTTVLIEAKDPGNGTPYPPSQAFTYQATQTGVHYVKITARTSGALMRTYRLAICLINPPPPPPRMPARIQVDVPNLRLASNQD
jgi:hypothetical protein